MADQANVYVKNNSTLTGDITALRILPDGSQGGSTTIGFGVKEKITLLGLDEKILINATSGGDLTTCYVAVRSDVDVQVKHSAEAPNWTIQIVPNTAPPNTPTTTNVSVGDDEPE